MAGILKLKNELDNSWTDIPALIGPQGKSAYQLAVENGFKGTESEWLASLKGADGEVTFESLTDEQKASLKGDTGETGATFIPSVSEDGTLSWINDKDFINPTPVNIRGPQGAQGEQGIQGLQGPQGEPGQDGTDGLPALTYGKAKETTVTPTVGGVTNFIETGDLPPSLFNRTPVVGDRFILLALRTTTGQTFILECEITLVTTYVASKNISVVETTGEQGPAGADGHTPQRGVDYWTTADQQQIVQDVLAALPEAEEVSV